MRTGMCMWEAREKVDERCSFIKTLRLGAARYCVMNNAHLALFITRRGQAASWRH